jgi:DNA-binding beta-propeller fold protein YncE
MLIALLGALGLAACGAPAAETADWENLTPVANVIDGPTQPDRMHPYAAALTSTGSTAVITLRGSELEPGSVVAIMKTSSGDVERVPVGDRPVAVRVVPGDNFAIVLSHFSPFASVIDISGRQVRNRIEVGYYAEDLIISDDGSYMYVSNRAEDSVQRWRLSAFDGGLAGSLEATAPAGVNPGALALSPDQTKLYVSDHGGLGLRVFSADTLQELPFIPFNAQVTDVKRMGQWLVATTMNDTNGMPCEDDGDYIGTQGDGILPIVTDHTCGRGFSDIQNEIAFVDPASDSITVRYTSDTAEISEADREGDYDPDLMRVVGALPHSIAVVGDSRAFVSMGASNEAVEIEVVPGAVPQLLTTKVWSTGHAPRGIAASADGTVVVVANMLGETVSVITTAEDEVAERVVGDNNPPFPATSAEIGELFFHSSQYSTDGDQSCTHCHLNSENDNKAWGVDVVRAFGRRATLPMRNLATTKPLLVEGVFDENDFSLEMEGIAFRPDFHDSSYTLQVERRDDFFRMRSTELFGGDVGFEAMVLHVGAFLMVETRLLPSPFPKDTPEVERGRALFMRPDVACAACHPEPTFASEDLFEGITTLGRYDYPKRDLDPDISVKFIQNAKDGFFNSNSLRGLWDRKGSFFHDGRARTVRETILTPGHMCLKPGELPFNEFNGQVDTNGGISHLTCEQIDDLVAFLMTID